MHVISAHVGRVLVRTWCHIKRVIGVKGALMVTKIIDFTNEDCVLQKSYASDVAK